MAYQNGLPRPDVGRLQLPQEDDESTGTVTPREEVLPPGKVRFFHDVGHGRMFDKNAGFVRCLSVLS